MTYLIFFSSTPVRWVEAFETYQFITGVFRVKKKKKRGNVIQGQNKTRPPTVITYTAITLPKLGSKSAALGLM